MRVVDKRHERYTVYIGRGTVFGNPFTHLPLASTVAAVQVNTIEDAVRCFGQWARCENPLWEDVWPEQRRKMLEAISQLTEDDVLGCFGCKPMCHGDVIIELWQEMRRGLRYVH